MKTIEEMKRQLTSMFKDLQPVVDYCVNYVDAKVHELVLYPNGK